MADEKKIDKILSTVTDVRIDTSAMKQNLAQLNANTTQLFQRTEQHGERIAKVEVQVDNTEEILTRHIGEKQIHSSSSHLPAQNGLSPKQRAALAVGGGSLGGAGIIYSVIEFLKWFTSG